jgi:hypothetical protein
MCDAALDPSDTGQMAREPMVVRPTTGAADRVQGCSWADGVK